MNYRVKPKIYFYVNIALHCIAATFFFFASLKSRCLVFPSPEYCYFPFPNSLCILLPRIKWCLHYSKRYDIKKRCQNVLDLKLHCCYWFACMHLCWTLDQTKMILLDTFYTWTGPRVSFNIWMFFFMLENIGKALSKNFVLRFAMKCDFWERFWDRWIEC